MKQGVYRVGVRKVESWEPKYAVNDGVTCFGLFWDRQNARLTAMLLNAQTPRTTPKARKRR